MWLGVGVWGLGFGVWGSLSALCLLRPKEHRAVQRSGEKPLAVAQEAAGVGLSKPASPRPLLR